MQQEECQLRQKLSKIKHQILVLSGKGGVGKSFVAANIAVALANEGQKVGLLDIDIHGPSIPKILGLQGKKLEATEEGLLPVLISENLKVMSIGFMLQEDSQAVIWRGPRKYQIIKQFLKDVLWGDLDFLIIDSPPGTGDEPLAIVQLLEQPDGAVIVTTPQEVSLLDVKKSISFCKDLNVNVIGLLENMSGFLCPHCNKKIDIFKSGGGKKLADEMDVPFLGAIPIDPEITHAGDKGTPYIYHYSKTETAKKFHEAISPILEI